MPDTGLQRHGGFPAWCFDSQTECSLIRPLDAIQREPGDPIPTSKLGKTIIDANNQRCNQSGRSLLCFHKYATRHHSFGGSVHAPVVRDMLQTNIRSRQSRATSNEAGFWWRSCPVPPLKAQLIQRPSTFPLTMRLRIPDHDHPLP